MTKITRLCLASDFLQIICAYSLLEGMAELKTLQGKLCLKRHKQSKAQRLHEKIKLRGNNQACLRFVCLQQWQFSSGNDKKHLGAGVGVCVIYKPWVTTVSLGYGLSPYSHRGQELHGRWVAVGAVLRHPPEAGGQQGVVSNSPNPPGAFGIFAQLFPSRAMSRSCCPSPFSWGAVLPVTLGHERSINRA